MVVVLVKTIFLEEKVYRDCIPIREDKYQNKTVPKNEKARSTSALPEC